MKDFRALIIGTDINAYYLARCYHEYTGKKADMLGRYDVGSKPHSYTRYTNILNMKYVTDLWDEQVFLNELDKYYNEHKDEKILLVSSNETYGEFIAKNQNKLKKKFYFNYPSVKLQKTLVFKELFYKTYENSVLDLPKTIYRDLKKEDVLDKIDIKFPVIVKPSNVIKFKHMTFKGKEKVYRLETLEELNRVIMLFKNGGYDDTLIIQEYIPGGDSNLFEAVVYCDKHKKIKQVSFAEVGLQEHTKNLIGNSTIIINGFSKFLGVTKQIEKIKEFMESIGYQGFAGFDMKYDERDGLFKVLEINARQGRGSYYLSPCGYNLIETLARDLIYDEKLEFHVIDKPQLLTFIPKFIAKKYIIDDEIKAKTLELWPTRVNPLVYKKDTSFLRKLLLFKIIYINYYKNYKNSTWDWK